MMTFFLDADERVYARYGGRDGRDADNRQSLVGLRAAMQSVLAMHAQETKEFAPKSQSSSKFISSEVGFKGGGRCMHCHQVKEVLNRRLKKDGEWEREQAWRYPLPDNLGIVLDVDRGNVVKLVKEKSPAAGAGLRPGDVLRRLGAVPVHSFGDAQFALDKAPLTGVISAAWQRDKETMTNEIRLPEGWRKTDISWRHSVRNLVPSIRLSGDDLTAAEKESLGLGPKQLAFRQSKIVSSQAKTAGIQAGDIIFGLDDQVLLMDSFELIHHVQRAYLVGDTVQVNLVRDGKRVKVAMKLGR